MAELKLKLSICDSDVFKEMFSKICKLMEQIEMSDFEDENGHKLKNNIAYIELKNILGGVINNEI